MNCKALGLAVGFVFAHTLVGCSSTKSASPVVVQTPNELWWNDALISPMVKKNIGNDSAPIFESDTRKNMAGVRKNMASVSSIPFSIGFLDTKEINAFATKQNGQNLIIFTDGFIREFGNDPDVLASVLGHELGHHYLGHTSPDYAKNRDMAVNGFSQALGMISSYFIPFSGLLVGNAVKGVGLSYSRDDERDADKFGMKMALLAGYSACGSYRFAMKMNSLDQGTVLTFLSTHPGNEERIKNSEEFNRTQKNRSCTNSLN